MSDMQGCTDRFHFRLAQTYFLNCFNSSQLGSEPIPRFAFLWTSPADPWNPLVASIALPSSDLEIEGDQSDQPLGPLKVDHGKTQRSDSVVCGQLGPPAPAAPRGSWRGSGSRTGTRSKRSRWLWLGFHKILKQRADTLPPTNVEVQKGQLFRRKKESSPSTGVCALLAGGRGTITDHTRRKAGLTTDKGDHSLALRTDLVQHSVLHLL